MSLLFSDLQDEVKRRATRDQGGSQFNTSIKNAINLALLRIAREAPWRVLRREGRFTTETSYTTGSGNVSVTKDSTAFSVTGATFLTDNIKIGRRVQFGTDSRVYEIRTITSETAGTLDRDYDGTTSTDTTYEILPTEEYILPPQVSHRMFCWHEEYGYPLKLDYVSEHDFRSSGVDTTQTGTPTLYRMWQEGMAENQPKQAGVLRVSSADSGDTSITVTIQGIVGGFPDTEQIITDGSNGTTAVSGSKSFTSVERVSKAASTTGIITVDADSANTTVARLPAGDATAGILYKMVKLWPLPDDVFPINVYYYKDPWRLVNAEDIQEMGQEFDETIILLSVAKIKYQTSKREGERFEKMYKDEIKTLKRTNIDKVDHFRTLQRPFLHRGRELLHRNLSYAQLGGNFGPRVF